MAWCGWRVVSAVVLVVGVRACVGVRSLMRGTHARDLALGGTTLQGLQSLWHPDPQDSAASDPHDPKSTFRHFLRNSERQKVRRRHDRKNKRRNHIPMPKVGPPGPPGPRGPPGPAGADGGPLSTADLEAYIRDFLEELVSERNGSVVVGGDWQAGVSGAGVGVSGAGVGVSGAGVGVSGAGVGVSGAVGGGGRWDRGRRGRVTVAFTASLPRPTNLRPGLLTVVDTFTITFAPGVFERRVVLEAGGFTLTKGGIYQVAATLVLLPRAPAPPKPHKDIRVYLCVNACDADNRRVEWRGEMGDGAVTAVVTGHVMVHRGDTIMAAVHNLARRPLQVAPGSTFSAVFMGS